MKADKLCSNGCIRSDCFCTIHKQTERYSICVCPDCEKELSLKYSELLKDFNILKNKLDKAINLLSDCDLIKLDD